MATPPPHPPPPRRPPYPEEVPFKFQCTVFTRISAELE